MQEMTLQKLHGGLWLAVVLMFAPTILGGELVYRPAPDQVLIAHDQNADCQIRFSTNVSDKARDSMLESIRRLQTYLYRLTGARPPVAGLDAIATNSPVAAIIEINAEVWKAVTRRPCYGIVLVQPSATSFYPVPAIYISAEPDVEGTVSPENKILVKRGCVEKALDAFVHQYFGIPLSAIDDPSFDWKPHMRATLGIRYDQFEPMQSSERQ